MPLGLPMVRFANVLGLAARSGMADPVVALLQQLLFLRGKGFPWHPPYGT